MSCATLALITTTILYDEMGWARHFVGKNICGVFGYVTFEIGATTIMSMFIFHMFPVRCKNVFSLQVVCLILMVSPLERFYSVEW